MTYKELLKSLAGYSGNFDDEVVFVNYKEPFEIGKDGSQIFKITSVGIKDGRCRLNNAYAEE